jgi:sulfatase modifying factor 1
MRGSPTQNRPSTDGWPGLNLCALGGMLVAACAYPKLHMGDRDAGAGIGGTSSPDGTSHGSGCSAGLELIQVGSGLCVAKMVAISGPSQDGSVADASTADYSIDATEVTRGQYQAWLATSPALPSSADPNCGWKSSGDYAADSTCMSSPDVCQTECDDHPQVCVDWCDAYAYCAGVGKRLCGAIGDGPNAYASYADARTSQWYRACSSGGTMAYPYGNTYDPGACNYDADSTVKVGSLAACVTSASGYAGVYDVSGNAWEWEDSCDLTGPSGYCFARGGSFHLGSGDGSCDNRSISHRSDVRDIYGFRCCSF